MSEQRRQKIKAMVLLSSAAITVLICLILGWFASFRFVWVGVIMVSVLAIILLLAARRLEGIARVLRLTLGALLLLAWLVTFYKSTIERRYFFHYDHATAVDVEKKIENFKTRAAADNALLDKGQKKKKGK